LNLLKHLTKLRVFEVLKNSNRVSSVDIFRSIAIIAVVFQHYNNSLPMGHLGVDLFFVISGLLVGGLLTKDINSGNKINYAKFVIQRGFKIIPSYYVFLALGTILAIWFYKTSSPEQIIDFWDFKRYIFFYTNVVGMPKHWSFGHLWSLSVEEQFYIVLPILFLVIQKFVTDKYKANALFVFIILIIAGCIFIKYYSYLHCIDKSKFSSKYNKDSLALGVFLNLVITYFGERLKSIKFNVVTFLSGVILFMASCAALYFKCAVFNAVFFHSFVSFSFFLMILGLYYVDFSNWVVLRVIAYYSYNWYLWHRIFVIFITQHLGNTITGLTVYLLISFIFAVLATIFIEEPFLKRRGYVLSKLFNKD
jgi:peptidoglycan/LPS O-acetylase OafA/YrhL